MGMARLPPSSHGSSLPSDIIFHPWKKEDNGNQSRVILYTITLTNPLAPKTATVRETQVSPGQRPVRAGWKSLCSVMEDSGETSGRSVWVTVLFSPDTAAFDMLRCCHFPWFRVPVQKLGVGWGDWEGGAFPVLLLVSLVPRPSPPHRPCTRRARRASATWSTPRSSRTTCRITTTSTPSTATLSPAWPGTRVDSGAVSAAERVRSKFLVHLGRRGRWVCWPLPRPFFCLLAGASETPPPAPS